MAGEIAKMSVVLSSDSARFNKGMKDASDSLSRFRSQVSSGLGLDSLLSPMTLAAGATVAAVAGLGALVKSQMSAIDSTAKLADSLGFSTESLTGLQYAGSLAGVEGEELTMSMARLTRKLGEAEQGSLEAVAALEKLGLTSQELQGMAPEQALGKIADSMKKLPSDFQRVNAAMEIFGKTGFKMLPLLKEGSEGIARQTKEAKELGATFSRIDAAKVEEANDALTTSWTAMKGIANELAIGFSPAITSAAHLMTSAFKEVRDMLKLQETMLKDAKIFWTTTFDSIGGTVKNLAKEINDLIPLDKIAKLADLTERFGFGGKKKDKGEKKDEGSGHSFMNDLFPAWGVYREYLDMQKKFDELATAPDDAFNRHMAAALREMPPAAYDAKAALEQLSKGLKDVETEIGHLADLSDTRLPEDKLFAKIEEQIHGMALGSIEEANLLDRASREWEKAKAKNRETENAAVFSEYFQAADKVARDIESPFAKVRNELADLTDLLQAGVIEWDAFDKASAKALQGLDAALGLEKTATEKHSQALAALQRMRAEGLDDERFRRAVRAVDAQFDEAMGNGKEIRLAAAVQRGSAEDLAAVARFSFQGKLETKTDSLPGLLRESINVQKRAIAVLDKIEGNTKERDEVVTIP